MPLKDKKFVMSYSGGKDSMLALYKALQSGLLPHSLFNMFNVDVGLSWFHSLPESVFKQLARAIDIPIKLVKTCGKDYADNFEAVLRNFKQQGVDVCVFGDIDIDGHRQWCTERCDNVGMIAHFPLWQQSRKSLVYTFIDSGFKAVITTIDLKTVSEDLIGLTLDRSVTDRIELAGADICGENGEYHTFVYDGPLFQHPIEFHISDKVYKEHYCILKLDCGGGN